MKSYVLTAFLETPWAILPSKLVLLEEIVIRHVNGEKLDAEEIEMRIHGATRPPERTAVTPQGKRSGAPSVAVLPLFGTIFPRANLMTQSSGATSAERFGAQFADLVNDPEIGAIALDVNSPGGQASGIQELAQQIYDARGKKPIVAVANHLMASAAYWISTAADEIVVTPSADVGSIGVFAVHQDFSKALENDGIKTTLVKAGKYKAEFAPYFPLTEEAQGAMQDMVNEIYDAFVGAVARNRGVEADTVRNGFGEGRVVSARQAVDLGMADRIGTLNETVNRLLTAQMQPTAGTMGRSQAEIVIIPEGTTTSQESEPVNEASETDAEFETQAQRLRDEVSQFLKNPAAFEREKE